MKISFKLKIQFKVIKIRVIQWIKFLIVKIKKIKKFFSLKNKEKVLNL